MSGDTPSRRAQGPIMLRKRLYLKSKNTSICLLKSAIQTVILIHARKYRDLRYIQLLIH